MLKVCFLIPFLWFSLNSEAESIDVATDTWKGFSEKDGSGLYFDVLREVFTPHNIAINISFLPHSRATASVRRAENDMVPGVYTDFFPEHYYSKFPIEMESVDAAMRKETFLEWRQRGTIDSYHVAARYGAFLNQYYDVGEKYTEIRTIEAMIKMLSSGRIDVVLNYKREMEDAIKSMQVDNVVIVESMFKRPAYFVFADTEKAQRLKRLFDQAMPEIIKSGKMKKLVLQNLGEEKYYPDYEGLVSSSDD